MLGLFKYYNIIVIYLLLSYLSISLYRYSLFDLLILIQEYTNEEENHGTEDEEGESELLREEEATEKSCDHVSSCPSVLLDNVVQLLEDGGHHQAPHTAEH